MQAERKFLVRTVDGRMLLLVLRGGFGDYRAVLGAFASTTQYEDVSHEERVGEASWTLTPAVLWF